MACSLKSTAWFTLYIVTQVLVSSFLMFYQSFTDEEYMYRFVEEFEPFIDESTWFIPVNEDTLQAYIDLIVPFVYPTLIITGIVIIGVYFIKNWKKRELSIQPIEWDQVFFYLFVGVVLNMIVTFCVNTLPVSWTQGHDLLSLELATSSGFWVNLLAIGIIGPITEEIVFRYGMQRAFYRFHPRIAIIYQAVIFGLLHSNPIQIMYAILLGILFGIVYYKKGKLRYTILLHSAINTSSVLVANMQNQMLDFVFLVVISCLCWCLMSCCKEVKELESLL